MTWYAIDDIGDAIDATKEFVLPFEWWTWLRLAVVVAVLGGAGGSIGQVTNLFQFAPGRDFEASGLLAPLASEPTSLAGLLQAGPPEIDPEMVIGPILILVVAVLLLAVVAMLLLGAIGACMEFVLVESLRHDRVQVGGDFGRNFVNGLRLAVFRFGLFLAVALLIGGTVVWQLGTDPTAWTEAQILNALAPLLVVGILVILLTLIINGFTNVFVVPIMLVEDRGVLSAWRRLLGTIAGNVGQFLLYLVVSVLLGIAVNIVMGFAVLFALIAVAIPVGIVTILLLTVLSGPLLWVLGGIVVFVGLVALILAGLFISVPLLAFLRYYALFVLGDVEPALDPLPEMRQRVRQGPDREPV